ncbi:MAG: porin [Pseudomonadales bacterium]|nr:porin [Pseudomonadales bacterium]
MTTSFLTRSLLQSLTRRFLPFAVTPIQPCPHRHDVFQGMRKNAAYPRGADSVFRSLAVKGTLATLLSVMLVTGPRTLVAAPSAEEIWAVVQQQQQELERLRTELLASQQKLAEAQRKMAAAGDSQAELDRQKSELQETRAMVEATVAGIESGAYGGSASPTHLGGYGELHYNNTDSGDQIDFHRFVLFATHQFTDNLSLVSELELEHSIAGDGKVGEIELEQAYVQWDYTAGHHSRMGLFLVPVGILNETHEPETFYGVERNNIEKNIIPATWWEAGVMFGGEFLPGWSYDLAIHSGLNLDTDNTSASKRSNIRSARQKVGEANADSLAYTGRISYRGVPGLQLSAALQYQTDLAQGDADKVGIDTIGATLFEADMVWQRDNFSLRALYAQWDIDSEINLLDPGADEQYGWYIEPAYRVTQDLGVFARYGRYDLKAGTSASSDERNQFDIGVNYWLHDNVVIKFDYQMQDNDRATDVDGFNLGVGYSF